nr:zinc finger CCCH domain-containing protein 19 [Ipomoea batatas]
MPKRKDKDKDDDENQTKEVIAVSPMGGRALRVQGCEGLIREYFEIIKEKEGFDADTVRKAKSRLDKDKNDSDFDEKEMEGLGSSDAVTNDIQSLSETNISDANEFLNAFLVSSDEIPYANGSISSHGRH